MILANDIESGKVYKHDNYSEEYRLCLKCEKKALSSKVEVTWLILSGREKMKIWLVWYAHGHWYALTPLL